MRSETSRLSWRVAQCAFTSAFVGIVVCGILLAPATVLNAQNAAPGTTASQTGIIRGHVTAAATGQPLARVRISLVPTTPGSSIRLAASTNVQGAFELTDVPPGQYRVSAARPGYLTLQWGQQRAREAGRPVDVKIGQTIERIDVALPKGGVMAGQITDELGQPYPGVRVEALELRYFQNGPRREPFPASAATTDDRGQFRIDDLQPGQYYLTATSAERWIGSDRQGYGFGATFFPGVPVSLAQPLTIGLAQQRTDLNFSLTAARTVRVAGRAQASSGEPLNIETVQFNREVGRGAIAVAAIASARINRDGTFELPDIMPGDYRLNVRGRTSSGQTESGNLSVKVTGAALEGLVVVARANTGTNVAGVVVTDENTPVPFPTVALRVLLTPGDNDRIIPSVRVFNVTADATFRLTAIGGPFYFRLNGVPDGWMLKQVRMNDEDITEIPFDVPVAGKDMSGLQMVLTQKVGRVTGTVADERGQPTGNATVVVFPEDIGLVNPATRLLRTIRPETDGRFTVPQLPAGKYRAAVRDYVEEGQQDDPTFLEELARDASRFELFEGSSAAVALRLRRQ